MRAVPRQGLSAMMFLRQFPVYRSRQPGLANLIGQFNPAPLQCGIGHVSRPKLFQSYGNIPKDNSRQNAQAISQRFPCIETHPKVHSGPRRPQPVYQS